MDEKALLLGNAKGNEVKHSVHTPSTIQADTLFTFTRSLEYLIPYIKQKMISPRYCVEDIRYLKIPKLKKIAIPMKCFCDINMHRLDIHLNWYGYYGLAFSKEWGMKNGIQPVQYINKDSALTRDFSTAFAATLRSPAKKKGSAHEKLQNYILHELMYYKPYEGKMENRNSGKTKTKCFTDECEWRFVPDVTPAGFVQAYFDKTILNAGVLNEISNAMAGIAGISLPFGYSDIKYIIIKSKADFEKLVEELLELDRTIQNELISKVIIWDDSGRDF